MERNFFIFNSYNITKIIVFGFQLSFSSKMCIFVVQFISMSTIILSIGSNTFAKTNIDKAKRMLSRLFPEITFTQPILTEPEEEKYSYLFRNILAKAETDMTPEEVIDKIKQTERAVGRSPKDDIGKSNHRHRSHSIITTKFCALKTMDAIMCSSFWSCCNSKKQLQQHHRPPLP